jgi:predicted ArsR family transcriptional regulator
MKILQRLRNRSPRGDAGDPGSAEASSRDADQLPIPGYDRLKDKEVTEHLSQLSQVELAAVETYERSHRGRPAVLDKLRYMRTSEPLPGYDALSPEQIVKALAGADAETVKAVRDYERKFGRRQQVLAEAARVLPAAPPSAGEDRARKEQEARVREGFAGQGKTARGLADSRSEPPAASD